MYANKVKKVVAVHDLSGVGRVSLTVVIPILSSMGFQVCPLPTAVLSSHTQYPEFSFLDLTDEMPKIISEWIRIPINRKENVTNLHGLKCQTKRLMKNQSWQMSKLKKLMTQKQMKKSNANRGRYLNKVFPFSFWEDAYG